MLDGEQGGILGGDPSVFPDTRTLLTDCNGCKSAQCETERYARSCIVTPATELCQSIRTCILTEQSNCVLVSEFCVRTEVCVMTTDC